MAKVGAQRAAELTGKSKSTIQRAMNNGKISFEKDNNGRRVIDVSELDRVYGLIQTGSQTTAVEQELEKASSMLEMERMKMQIKMLEDKLELAESQIEDLKDQRDQWQKQASQVLLTNQNTQKQADELREELKERERRAMERREERKRARLEEQMKKLAAENENEKAESAVDFQNLWQKIRGAAGQ